jgi:hypothetical protein
VQRRFDFFEDVEGGESEAGNGIALVVEGSNAVGIIETGTGARETELASTEEESDEAISAGGKVSGGGANVCMSRKSDSATFVLSLRCSSSDSPSMTLSIVSFLFNAFSWSVRCDLR